VLFMVRFAGRLSLGALPGLSCGLSRLGGGTDGLRGRLPAPLGARGAVASM
jgi:hypothetical protein